MDNNKFFIPPVLIVLDSIGAGLLALGFAKRFANVDVLPQSVLFENYANNFMIIGAVMMLPAIIHIIEKVRDINRKNYNRRQ